MRAAILARKTHKWLGLVIGIQALIWALSGLYMVAVPIEIIHGDHFVHDGHTAPALPLDRVRVEIADLRHRHGDVRSIRLKDLAGKPAYVVETTTGPVLIDAATGEKLSPLDENTIRTLAQHHYAGQGEITRIAWLDTSPLEVQARPAPLWQVQFEGWNKHTLYFSPHTGDLLARRHELWRLFDFLWMFHIMDYAAILGVLGTFSGVWLLVHSFRRARRAPGGTRG